jgi:hypothetical protein
VLLPDLRSKLSVGIGRDFTKKTRPMMSRDGDASGHDRDVFLRNLPSRRPQTGSPIKPLRFSTPSRPCGGTTRARESARSRPLPMFPSVSIRNKGRDGGGAPTLRQTCRWPKPLAQGAFKTSMVHILQFTLRIAFRCVLHRYGSQDIRC